MGKWKPGDEKKKWEENENINMVRNEKEKKRKKEKGRNVSCETRRKDLTDGLKEY